MITPTAPTPKNGIRIHKAMLPAVVAASTVIINLENINNTTINIVDP